MSMVGVSTPRPSGRPPFDPNPMTPVHKGSLLL